MSRSSTIHATLLCIWMERGGVMWRQVAGTTNTVQLFPATAATLKATAASPLLPHTTAPCCLVGLCVCSCRVSSRGPPAGAAAAAGCCCGRGQLQLCVSAEPGLVHGGAACEPQQFATGLGEGALVCCFGKGACNVWIWKLPNCMDQCFSYTQLITWIFPIERLPNSTDLPATSSSVPQGWCVCCCLPAMLGVVLVFYTPQICLDIGPART